MPDFHFSLSYHLAFLLLAAAGSVLLSMFLYRTTVPPISQRLRVFFIALRAVGLFLLIWLLGEPIVSLVFHSSERPGVAVLIDNSKSMTLTEKTGKRSDKLFSVLQSSVWREAANRGDLVPILFDEKIRRISRIDVDSMSLKGEGTDIAGALRFCQTMSASSNLQAIVLITDGNSTGGVQPYSEAETAGLPIFTVGIGDTIEQKDIAIRKLISNEIAYAGSSVPVYVTVHNGGYTGSRVLVTLSDSAKRLAEQTVMFDQENRDYMVPLSFIPTREGIQKFTVEVTALPGEITAQNNRYIFYSKILKSKLNIALIAGSPNQDVAFVKRALQSDQNISVEDWIQREDGTWGDRTLSRSSLENADALVVIGFPEQSARESDLQVLIDNGLAGKPLLFILSRTIDYTKLQKVSAILPFVAEAPVSTEMQVFSNIPSARQANPILKISSTLSSVDAWQKLPPVFRPQTRFRAKVESEVLATVRLQTLPLNDPFILSRNINGQKSIAVLGYGLWRWQMLTDAGSGLEPALKKFIGNSIRWLTTQEDRKKIRVMSAKQIYSSQEEVELTAQIYDESLQPVDDARCEVRIQRKDDSHILLLNSLGNGQYQGSIDRLSAGDYSYSAEVFFEGQKLGADQGTFSVGGLTVEFLETRMNKPMLQHIAARTGGRYYEPKTVSTLAGDLESLPHFKQKDVTSSTEIPLWNSRWILLAVIFIFSLEWFLRKRSGMI